jgi:Glycosyl transferase family 2
MTTLFKDRNLCFEANVGRPRTVLVVGTELAQSAQLCRDRGAHVTALEGEPHALSQTEDIANEVHTLGPALYEPVGGRRFDLILFDTVEPRFDLDELLAVSAELLEDGGHVIAMVVDRERIRDRVAAAGLELLRVDYEPRVTKAMAEAMQTSEDLQILHTTSFRFTERLMWPVERIAAKAVPSVFATDAVFVARRAPKKGSLSLTVGMLTLNEKDSVERMIDDIRAVAPDAKLLLIDSSSDETPDLARAKGARVVRQLPPRGHGPAMERLMYEAALESDALIYIDCDFTYPTKEIARIREELEEGADVVNASRTSRYPEAMPVPNFIANRVFAAAASAVHGLPTTDVHSGMRGYRSSVIRAFNFSGSGDALPLDTLILPARSNYHVIEFPIEYSERVGVSKLAKFRGTLWTFIRIAGAVGKGDRVRRGRRYVNAR